MRLIFLDIDGVLNSDLWFKSEAASKLTHPQNQFDPRCVALLQKILDRTEASVVLSSTWRKNHSKHQMRSIFESVGLRLNLGDFTPVLAEKNNGIIRGNEILKWCMDNESTLGGSYRR